MSRANNKEKYKNYDHQYYIKHKRPKSKIGQAEQRIAELEEQLKKKPKFNVGDKVYLINKDEEVERDFIESIDIDTFGIEYYTVMHSICWYENELFATEEEAQAKLKELQGEKR